ncbi:MAG: PH domain-containing protein [Gemmatimonadota bacterium]
MDALVFRSRIDPWLAALTFGPVVIVGALGIRRAIVAQRAPSLALAATLGIAIALLAWIFLDTSYRVTSSDLLVRSGPLRITVPLRDIRGVRRTRSVLSAPALSLRRLEVSAANGRVVVISPADEVGFLTALRDRGATFEWTAAPR